MGLYPIAEAGGGMIYKIVSKAIPLGLMAAGLGLFLVTLNQAAPSTQVERRAAIIKQMQATAELTTAVFTIETVVPVSQSAKALGVEYGKTNLMYLGKVQVRAGFDLSQVKAPDVIVEGDLVTIKLPPPEILGAEIDTEASKVQQYDRGVLGLGPDVAPDLISTAQKTAIEQGRKAACDQKVLELAGSNAQLALLSIAGKDAVILAQPSDICH